MTEDELKEIEDRCNVAISSLNAFGKFYGTVRLLSALLRTDIPVLAQALREAWAEISRLKPFEPEDVEPCEFCGNSEGFDDEDYCRFCNKKISGYCEHCNCPMDEHAEEFYSDECVVCSQDCVDAREARK